MLAHLRMTPQDEFSESSDWQYAIARGSDSWALIHANRCDFAQTAPLKHLSRNGTLYAFYAEEHFMVSGISCWHGGMEQWSIDHDPAQGVDHLETAGLLPALVETSRQAHAGRRIVNSDIPVDHIFSIPLDVGEQLVGYRYDKDTPDPMRFQRVHRDRRWWQFWL